MKNMNLTILVCNYNTPDLVLNLLKTVDLYCEEKPEVIIMNTSSGPSQELIDNSVPHFNFKNASHGEAVNLGFKKVQTRYVLLMDSDVLLLKDFSKAFETFKNGKFALMGKVVGDCGGKRLHPRVEPWFCFMDLDQLKSHKIDFFDREKTLASKKTDVVYDIGSTMFEKIQEKGLLIADADIENKYFRHYGGMSWRAQKYNPNDVDTDIDFGGTHPHRVLYDIAQETNRRYLADVERLFQ